ncbi:hypothetical protein F4677DRAFT_427124 [Hypoxylon crocopeplum]|nr:hypothetical protein F4677DRAFT_427124 [Hypoxylon crocopeplum]
MKMTADDSRPNGLFHTSTTGAHELKGRHGINGTKGINGTNGSNGVNGANGINEIIRTREPIAIIGCGMRLPGGVHDSTAFWELLTNKRDGHCLVPADRYNISAYHSKQPGKPGQVASEYGYFLDVNPAEADPSFWSMTARELSELDPQQRLALEVTYETLQSSGTTQWRGKLIGVYVGVFGEDWAHIQAQDDQDLGMYRIAGYGDFAVANRISYELGFKGPSMVIRTACSSSLTGLHEACLALESGECESAIVAGTNMILDPQMTASLTAQGVLSPQGHCRSFDADADGYARGEAVVAIQIKRLEHALRDNDPIRAVIKASCLNSDGKTAGLSQPNSESHAELIRRSHRLSGITDLSKTAMIECHGTGTQVGDPLEAGAVASVFRDHGILIGSVKPNVGHSEGASGITSVIKMMLALEHSQIPPNIKFQTGNKKIPFEDAKLKVPTEVMPWPEDRLERVGVNSFGIGGANAHVLIESAKCAGVDSFYASRNGVPARGHEAYLLNFTAHTADALRTVVQSHEKYLKAHPDRVDDLRYTLAIRREPLAHRAFSVVSNDSFGNDLVVSQFRKAYNDPRTIWTFTGQGAQWAQMGASLILEDENFKRTIQALELMLQSCRSPPTWSLSEELLKPSKTSRLSEAEFSQPCCTAIQVALVDMLKSWGMQPSAVLGHSSGEIGAAYASGVITADDAIRIAYFRGQATKSLLSQTGSVKKSATGGMAAVGLSRNEVEGFCVPGVLIGCENSPNSVTLSGDVEALTEVLQNISSTHPDSLVRRLRVECAYHSHHMELIAPDYEAMIVDIKGSPPRVPFYSSVSGGLLDSTTSLDAAYWTRNLVSPVLFSPAASAILRDLDSTLSSSSALVFLEVGPHSALAGPLRQIFRATRTAATAEYIPTLVRNNDAQFSVLATAGTLFQLGVDGIDLSAIIPKASVLTDLPTYPWQRSGHYWSESRLSKARRLREHLPHDILGTRVNDVSGSNPTWRNMLRLDNAPWIRDHKIESDMIFPGAGYVCIVGEATRQLTGVSPFTVREVNIKTALTMHEGQAVEIITSLKPARLTDTLDSTWYDFEISSFRGDTWVKHAFGQVRSESDAPRGETTPSNIDLAREVNSDRWYASMAHLGLNYSGRFQGLKRLKADVKSHHAGAIVNNRLDPGESVYAQHPSTIDLVFQLFSVAASNGVSRQLSSLAVPTYIGQLYVGHLEGDFEVEAQSTSTPRGVLRGSAKGMAEGKMVLKLENMQMTPLADVRDSRGDDPHAATELVWRPDINTIDNTALMQPRGSEGHLNLVGSFGRVLERMALACMVESSMLLQDLEPCQPFLLKFRSWLDKMRRLALEETYPMVPDCGDIVKMTSKERMRLISDIYEQVKDTKVWPVAAALQRIVLSCRDIFTGREDSIALLADGDVLAKIYDLGRFTDFGRFFNLASHYKPNLKILEIGAGTGGTTQPVLDSLTSADDKRMYYSYTFTDISSGFLVAAKDRFKNYDGIEYRTLDITKDPLGQGFEANSYDMIVASNVIHATPSIIESLKHVHKLLTPKGRLFLQEICPPTKWINFIMGTFSGWWLGEHDGRVEEPYLQPQKWDHVLRAAGFDGLDAVYCDEQFNNNMIAIPQQPKPTQVAVTLLSRETLMNSTSVSQLQEALRSRGYEVGVCRLGDLPPVDGAIISILDIDQPFFHEVDEEQFEWFKSLIASRECNKSSILWVTGAAQIACTDPRYAMTLGTARTIRNEMDMDFATLELDHFDDSGKWQGVVATCFSEFQSCLATASKSTDMMKPNYEWAFANNALQVGRFQWISVNHELSVSRSQSSDDETLETAAPRKLSIAKPGLLSSLCWWQTKPVVLEKDQVRIKNFAVGLNFKDVLISMGIVDGQAVDDEGLGCECAGVVEAVGPNVTDLSPGDRVMVLHIGAFATSIVANTEACAKIPAHLSFADAASMPTVYGTVIHSLLDKAQLEKGQTVLIHSACGGVGIAAVQICRMIGAEIFCTVGSENKVHHLMSQYGISKDRIFNSRDLSFHRDIMHATSGRGVDVVLNSLSGELLHGSWRCVAPHGCMIEIGKRDLIGHGALALDPFEENRSYFGIEFAHLSSQRPAIVSRILKDIVKYYDQGYITPIRPITEFEAARLEDAMRFMQKGNHIGKIVVTMPDHVQDLLAQSRRPAFCLLGDASYILVGGLGGLGQAIAIWMAEAGAREIIFLSRSATSRSYDAFLKELNAIGCNPVLVGGSVSSKEDVRRAVRAASHKIGGIIQMSMVLNDIKLLDMPFKDWADTVDTKVLGTWNLHAVLEEERQKDVDFFLLFSSYSGLVGHWGQANYAAANTFLDAFTQYRHSKGLTSATVDVGVMEDIGYVSRNANVLGHFHKTSTHVLREKDLLDAVQLLLQRSTPPKETGGRAYVNKAQIGLGVRSTQPLDSPNNRTVWKNDRRMAGYRNMEGGSAAASSSGNDQLKEFLSNAATDPGYLDTEASADFLAREVGRTLLGFMLRDAGNDDLAGLDVRQSLKDIGVDSLVGIELRNWFRQSLALEVTVIQLMESPSLLALGARVGQMLKERVMGPAQANKEYLETKMP